MTRGMKGCYIYCTDKALRDYLRMRVEDYWIEYDDENMIVKEISRH